MNIFLSLLQHRLTIYLARTAVVFMAFGPVPRPLFSAPPEETVTELKAGVYLSGADSGSYREETREQPDEVTDIVEQRYLLERLGSRIEMSMKETYRQDRNGRLKSGRFETSSSKSSIVTEVLVKPNGLQITAESGTGRYVRTVPLPGQLLGPQGLRLLLAGKSPSQSSSYRTFVSSIGAIKEITATCVGRETLSGGGTEVRALKTELAIEGIPGKTVLWVDESGRPVRMVQASPFGQIEIARANFKSAVAANAPPLGGTYESSVAVSNVRLPHPRKMRAITVELTKKTGAEPGWPAFSSDNQQISEKAADHVVVAVTQPDANLNSAGPAQSAPEYEKPNALVQSDDPEIRRVAAEVVAGETDPWRKALRLQRWVATNMQFDTGIAVAPASELVRDRHGTCIGYATLLAALSRAAAIPSRLKLGYVYDSGMWGGHAWTEVLVNGRWLPLDAAEYYPGVADAARIGVITASGESGTIDNVGDLAMLFGKVAIRVNSYTLGNREIRLGPNDSAHLVKENLYENRHLGLHASKPAGALFKDLDAHWPNRAVLTIQKKEGAATVFYGRAHPDRSLAEQAGDLIKVLKSHPWQDAHWHQAEAVSAQTEGKSALVARADDVLWGIIATGNNANSILERMQKSISIHDLLPVSNEKQP